jgi:hypothetical protein
MTGFYMAWFMVLFTSLVVLCALLQTGVGRGADGRAWRVCLAWPLIPIGAMLAVACLPFLVVYLPASRETGGHTFYEAMMYAPVPSDILHIGSKNLMFGGLDHWVSHALSPGADDYDGNTIGFPPLIAALALACAVLVWIKPKQDRLLRSIALATGLSLALMVHFGQHSLWYWVYNFFPGGSAVRVVSRYALFLTFPVVILAMSCLQAYSKNWPAWVIVGVGMLLAGEELNAFREDIALDRPHELKILAATPPPPATCRAFFVESPPNRASTGSVSFDALYPHNVDAMMVAESLHLPTINGFSTFNPPDWNFGFIRRPDYRQRVARYLDIHGLAQGVCALDLAHHTWTTTPELQLPQLMIGTSIDLGKEGNGADQYLGQGWQSVDQTGRWGEGRWANTDSAHLFFLLADPPSQDRTLHLNMNATAYGSSDHPPTAVTVAVNGTVIATWRPQPGAQILSAIIPRSLIGADRRLNIRLSVIPPPKSWGFHKPKGSTRIGLFAHAFGISEDDPAEHAQSGSSKAPAG